MTVFLVALISIVGTLVVERFRRDITDRRWLLDRRHEAYVDFIREASTLQHLLFTEGPAPDRPKGTASKAASELVAALRHAHARLILVGSAAVQERAGDLVLKLNGQLFATEAERQALLGEVEQALGELVGALRAEIQPPSRTLWRRSPAPPTTFSMAPPAGFETQKRASDRRPPGVA